MCRDSRIRRVFAVNPTLFISTRVTSPKVLDDACQVLFRIAITSFVSDDHGSSNLA
jgi:hypothetical protein